jgi:hypothetical protein
MNTPCAAIGIAADDQNETSCLNRGNRVAWLVTALLAALALMAVGVTAASESPVV